MATTARLRFQPCSACATSAVTSRSAQLAKSRWLIYSARFYRRPEPILQLRPPGTRIVVVGNGPSGSDIGRELASALPSDDVLYVSARSPSSWLAEDALGDRPWRKRIHVVTSIERIEPVDGRHGRLHMTDGTTIDDAGVILFATGYLYSFPFVRPDDEPFSSAPLIDAPAKGERPHAAASVSNLDAAQLFYVPDPTLALPCLQVRAALATGADCAVVGSAVPARRSAGAHDRGRLVRQRRSADGCPRRDQRIGKDQAQARLSRRVRALLTPATLTIRFEYEDALLRHIGEGSSSISSSEVAQNGALHALPPWRHALRQNALELRREQLGY